MTDQVTLLSRPANFAVVQLTERKFPGVVVQGDTLNALVNRLHQLALLLDSGELEDLRDGIADMKEVLAEARTHYEAVCSEYGIALPYVS